MKFRRGYELLREQGVRSLLRKSGRYYRSKLFLGFYKFRGVLSESIVDLNGVKIDYGNGYISTNIRDAIISGEYENNDVEMMEKHVRDDLPVIDLQSITSTAV